MRRRDIGPDAIHLADGKTGVRPVPLSTAARAVLDALPATRNADEFLFPYYASDRARQGRLLYRWHAICADAGIGRARLHDLRHTVASHPVMSGENPPLVGKLPGHRRHATTVGYAQLADDHLVAATEHVGNAIAAAMALRRSASDG